MALPWLIGAAVVGGLAYLGSDSSDDDDDYEREERAKRRARQRAIDEANSKIEKDIQRYKNQQEDYFKDKYDVEIEYIIQESSDIQNAGFGGMILASMYGQKDKVHILSVNRNFAEEIEALSIEADELQELRRELEGMRDAL